MNKEKWRVFYSMGTGTKNKHSEGFYTKGEALACMRDRVASGGWIKDIKRNGRSVLAAEVFVLISHAKLSLVPKAANAL